MQFDILNELVTSTVYDLFTNTSSVVLESKEKVKELEGLLRQESVSRRNSASQNQSIYSAASEAESRVRESVPLAHLYKTVPQWMQRQAPKRLKESFRKIGIEESLLRSSRKAQLERHVQAMSDEQLTNEKKKVKNELRCYDNDFVSCFKRQPNHEEKEPFRPLYAYYKRLKEQIGKRGIEEISQQRIEQQIRAIRQERTQLRVRIQTYQAQFEKTNNRRIRYLRDITPISAEYKRYKDLKVDLLRYESMLNN